MKGYAKPWEVQNHTYPDDCPECGEATMHEVATDVRVRPDAELGHVVTGEGYWVAWCRACGGHREGGKHV